MIRSVRMVFISIAIMVITSVLSSLCGQPFYHIIENKAVSYLVNGITYVCLTLLLISLYIRWENKRNDANGEELSFKSIGICRPHAIVIWIVTAVMLPAIVSLFYITFVPVELIGNTSYGALSRSGYIIQQCAYAVFLSGAGAGIVEEVVFRGVIMKAIEKAYNMKMAVILPSFIFGALHLTGMEEFDVMSVLLLLSGGTLVGIMFSLIRLQSGSVFASAIVHGLWNIIIIGGILDIGDSPWEQALLQYRITSGNMLLTGGSFGIEVALPAIIGYAVVSVIAVFMIKRKEIKG